MQAMEMQKRRLSGQRPVLIIGRLAMPTSMSSSLACTRSGSGTAVLCIHSSTASGRQWASLADSLQAASLQFLMPDLHGHGGSPAREPGPRNSLQLDADAAWACLPGDGPLHLLGHSYGGAVALQLALRHPERLLSLTLYEPLPFGLMPAQDPARIEIETVAAAVAELVAAGRLSEAAQRFCDYWAEGPAYAAMSEIQQQRLAQRLLAIPGHFEGLFDEGWQAQDFDRLRCPVLLLCGENTRAAARGVFAALQRRLPARAEHLPQAVHLSPLLDPARIDPWFRLGLGRA